MKFSRIAFVSTIVLALTLTLSCATHHDAGEKPFFDNPTYVCIEFPRGLEKVHGWNRDQLKEVAKSIAKQLKADLSSPPTGTPARVLRFGAKPQTDLNNQIVASYPIPQYKTFWLKDGNLDTLTEATIVAFNLNLEDPGPGTQICDRKVEVTRSPNGSLVVHHWALYCDKSCANSTSTCMWIQVASASDLPSLR